MTWRAFLLGLLGAVFIASVTPWNDFAKGNTFLTGSHFPAGVVAVLLMLTLAANPLLKLIRRAWALRQTELMLIWCMMIAACAVPASGFMRFWFPLCAAPAYYAARPDLAWEDNVLKEVPADLVLTKDPRSHAAKSFYEGTRTGEHVRIPWGLWLRPMAAWTAFALLFYATTFFLVGILRKQWVESERLLFPLARVPMEFTADAGEQHLLPGLMMRSKPLLVGMAASGAFSLVRVAPVLTGAEGGWLPRIPLDSILWGTPLGQLGIWAAHVYPVAIAFAFLVPSDVSLSIWVFFLFIRFEVQASYWIGRPLELCSLAMAAWFVYYRVSPLVAVGLVGVMLVLTLGIARLVAQGGVFLVLQQWKPVDLLHGLTGGRAFGAAAAVVAQMHNNVFFWDTRELLSAHAMNAMRISSVFERRKRLLLPAMAAALLLAVPVAAGSSLYMYYRIGAYNVGTTWGTRVHPINTFNKAERMITSPVQSAEPHFGSLAFGGGFMFLITLARMRFYWWPIHSLGFMMASSYAAHMVWLSAIAVSTALGLAGVRLGAIFLPN
ncbi:MAG: hypothetical protein AMK73_10145 [Planctomycetes bacterium SM23_32]|nr:MAG: hypothetical protein AMK73_10145 [Planctomycetes bacterium SM23_32]